MTDSLHLALPLIAAAQAQKHVTHNEALRCLDALVMLSIDDRDLSAPPGSPAEGARYLVKATGTGAFAGKDGKIAHFRDGAFAFHTPRAGWIAYVADEDALIVFDGSDWRSLPGAASEFQDVTLFGLGTIADAANPLSARLNNALFSARTVANGGDGDLRWKMSKESAADTVSLLLQDNFSGRAEIGLAGDDDLHLKVSNDGTTWREGLVIAAATGKVSFPQGAIGLREKLTANRTYYVRTDGSDSNNGLADTSGGAFLTLQKAYNTILTLDLAGFTVTVRCADGTYTSGLVISAPWIGGLIVFEGNTTTPDNVLISVSAGSAIDISATLPSIPVFSGFKVQSSAANGVSMSGVGRVDLNKVNFGACAAIKMSTSGGYARIHVAGDYTDTGNAIRHFSADHGAYISCSGRTITLSGTPAYSQYFAFANDRAGVSLIGSTFAGSGATGQRFLAQDGGTIATAGTDPATFIPGNSAGSGTHYGASPYGRYS